MSVDQVRVVIADDQPVIVAGFAALLDAQAGLTVVGTAPNGEQLLALVEEHQPDVALVDIRMPVLDGIEATRQITNRFNTKVLILTTFDLDAYVYDAIRAGASGFLLKDVTAERLVDAVRIIAEGSMLLGPAISRQLVTDFAARPSGSPRPGVIDSLTPREAETLQLVARGLSNSEIAAELVISVETVKSHVSELLRKLGVRDRIQAVVFAYENGLVR